MFGRVITGGGVYPTPVLLEGRVISWTGGTRSPKTRRSPRSGGIPAASHFRSPPEQCSLWPARESPGPAASPPTSRPVTFIEKQRSVSER